MRRVWIWVRWIRGYCFICTEHRCKDAIYCEKHKVGLAKGKGVI